MSFAASMTYERFGHTYGKTGIDQGAGRFGLALATPRYLS